MRLEEIVGHRIYDARKRAKMSQADLGRALGPLLGRPWSRQAVFAAEKGARDFRIAELVAIAHVLKTTVNQLVMPGPEVAGSPQERDSVMFPSGAALTSMELIDALLPEKVDLESESGQAARTGNELAGHIVEVRALLGQVDEAAAKSMETLVMLLQQMHVITRTPEREEPSR